MELKSVILLFYLGLQFAHNNAFVADHLPQFVDRDEIDYFEGKIVDDGQKSESNTETCGYEVESYLIIRIIA